MIQRVSGKNHSPCAIESLTKVLSLVFRIDGTQFAGATQLLPIGASAEQAEEALASLLKSLGGRIPETGHEKLKLARDYMAWREYRTSTKNLLCALSNCLQQSMPSGWTMVNCKPPNPLAPRGVTGERYPYLIQEQNLRHHPLGSDLRSWFVFDHKTNSRRPDFIIDEDFFRLCVSCDEGTEVGCVDQKGSVMFKSIPPPSNCFNGKLCFFLTYLLAGCVVGLIIPCQCHLNC